MTGLTDYSAKGQLEWLTGRQGMPVTVPNVFMALFTGVGSDSGAGFIEVSTAGTGYARPQIAGATTGWSGAAGQPVITMTPPVPSWIQTGMYAFDRTTPANIGGLAGLTILSINTGTGAVTLSGNLSGSVSGDTIAFSAFGAVVPSGPSTISNTSQINFPTALSSWGTVNSFGLYDASGGGNLLDWDYLGNFVWLPATVAPPGNTVTVPRHGYSVNDPVVFTTEFGGAPPSPALSGIQTVTGVTSDNFTVAGTNTTTGNGSVRKIVQQSVPTGVTASFVPSALVLTAA